MNIHDKDLNLLSVFEALWLERSVSAAAGRLHLSQSAVSHALARLRSALNDELFVRTSKGVAPTPQATLLAPVVKATLEQARTVFAAPEAFQPLAAEATLAMASTDFLEQLILPRMIARLRVEAPRMALRSMALHGRLPKEDLERGECDVAIAGFFGELPEGFRYTKLFDDHFVCILRQDHPLAQGPLTLDGYLSLDHLLVSPQGDLSGVVDRELAKMGRKRRIGAGIANFLTPAWVVAASDMILTIPYRIASLYLGHLPLVCLDLPLEVPGMTMRQVWHERTDRDPLHRWFRGMIEELCHY